MNSEIPEGYKTITEGKATIIFPENNDVFYNPVQVLNRDLSILSINMFGELLKKEADELKAAKPQRYENLKKKQVEYFTEKNDPIMAEDGMYILEALSASGLRSIRYWKEIHGVKRIIANDIADAAVKSIKRNVEYNKIPEGRVVPNQADATLYMYENRPSMTQFDVIDLDPYGSCSIFIDSAVQAIKNGGLMLVTCTDLAVLCGNHPEVSFSKYGANCPKTPFCHELALRIALGYINNVAAKYGRYIEVLAAFQIDFYIRMFVRVFDSKQEVKKTAFKSSIVYSCAACDNYYLQPLGKQVGDKYICNTNSTPLKCDQCGSSWIMAGPVWNGPLYSEKWLDNCIDRVKATPEGVIPTQKRLLGLLYAERSELHDVPLFYSLHSMCNTLHMNSPKMIEIQSGLIHAGYQVSQSHTDPLAIKTTAPSSVIFDLFRNWQEKHPLDINKLPEHSPAKKILTKKSQQDFNFDTEGVNVPTFEVARYPDNPEPNWGPKARASMKRSKEGDSKDAKKINE
ncbi:hypothetical protein WA158_001539 [Blastocystis sp. Blastoise]